MRSVALIALCVALVGCSSTGVVSREDLPQGLSAADIIALPPGTTLKEVKARLRYWTRAAVAVPLISFDLMGEPGAECTMWFDPKTLRLISAVKKVTHADGAKDEVPLWPSPKTSQNRPNKSLQPTATAVTPPACAGGAPSVAVAEH